MDSKLREWQLDIERIWSADAPDWREAARLADVMARMSGEVMLRHAAAQALPILRRAALRPPILISRMPRSAASVLSETCCIR